MSTYDGRKIDHKTKEAIRIRADQRILDSESLEVIAKILGYHRSVVYQWLKRYDAEGIDGLKYPKISGKKPALNKVQLQKFFDIITSKNPLDWWNRPKSSFIDAAHTAISGAFSAAEIVVMWLFKVE